jgi:hypothetical protein
MLLKVYISVCPSESDGVMATVIGNIPFRFKIADDFSNGPLYQKSS